MLTSYFLRVTLVLLVFGCIVDWAQAQSAPELNYAKQVQPLINKYCLKCHRGEKAMSGVQLEKTRSEQDILKQRKTWETVLKMVDKGLMPPEKQPRIPLEERRRFVSWLESKLFFLDCEKPRDPGRVTIRRLNRVEYNNTVRDLLGVDLQPADDFPSDDVGEGFDNIGDVLSLPPLLLEKYVAAAEKLAQASIAIVDPDKAPSQLREKEQLKPSGAANLTDYGVYSMYSQGGVRGGFRAPRDGDYLIRVAAGADQAGPEVAKVRVTVNGQKLRDIEVKAKRDDLDSYEIAWKGKRGALAISAEFINDYYQPKNPDPKLRGDRNLYVRSINLVGPLNNRPTDLPESHKRLVIATPNAGTTLEQASERVLRPLLQRAFRRKVTPDEVRAYQRFVKLANERGASYEEALRVALTAVLVSPHFLFRVETDPQPDDPQAAHDLAQYELASRLSYFLWSSMPDDQLFALATAGKLNDENVLESQVKRMLADEKAWAFVENFGGQWLNLRNLEEVSPDPNQFRTFNSALRRDMAKETLLFFEHVMREDRSVVEFIDGRYTFVNQRLASHYGMPNVVGDEFRRVALQGDRRAGVLTHASILTITSNPTRTSPVMRGKWILENILNDPPPDPPDNVPEFLAAQKASPNATLREQLELHRKNANCAVCHIKMDALGFGFENFDPIGRWRDQDGGKPIDSSGELPGGGKFSGPNELVQILKKSKARFCRSLTEKTLTYALGRGIEYYDRCAVDDVVSRLEQNDYRFSALVTGVVLSEPFRRRRGDRGENQ